MKLLVRLSYVIIPIFIIFISSILPFLIIKLKKIKNKDALRMFAILLLIFITINSLGMFFVSRNPIFIYDSGTKEHITEARKDEIKNAVIHLYHAGLLFPGVVRVKYSSDEAVSVKIYYFLYGNVEFNIDFSNGIEDITKPLY